MNYDKLAILGGKPSITELLPSWANKSGRSFDGEEKELLLQALETGHLGQVGGKFVPAFESLWAQMMDISTAVVTSSGTAALHTAMVFVHVGPGDEVLVPCISDMGTVIAILLQNAVPVFVDVEPLTQTMDPEDLARKITPHSKAVIPVHMFGLACDMDRIMAIARAHDLSVIEDCCQAHFSRYKGRLVGTIGDVGCFSFQQTKHISTGEGGMVVTNRDCMFSRPLKLCSDKGWPRDRYREHYFLAPNYHMTELQAAVGIAQLKKINEMIDCRRKSAQTLTAELGQVIGLRTPGDGEYGFHTYFAYQFEIIPEYFSATRDQIAEAIRQEGVPVADSYLPHPLYRYDFLQNSEYYNDTHCPLNCQYNHGAKSHADVFCAKAEQACKTGLFLGWNERITEEIAGRIGQAMVKVLSYYSTN
jgi:dTDP-4-amino-4,6-dideoxygalactose transaminase